jgi:hypothetical protein
LYAFNFVISENFKKSQNPAMKHPSLSEATRLSGFTLLDAFGGYSTLKFSLRINLPCGGDRFVLQQIMALYVLPFSAWRTDYSRNL